jgi:hypothetical protein
MRIQGFTPMLMPALPTAPPSTTLLLLVVSPSVVDGVPKG